MQPRFKSLISSRLRNSLFSIYRCCKQPHYRDKTVLLDSWLLVAPVKVFWDAGMARESEERNQRNKEGTGRSTGGTQCRSPAAVVPNQRARPSRRPGTCNGNALAEIPDPQILFRLGSFARSFGLRCSADTCLLAMIGTDCLLAHCWPID